MTIVIQYKNNKELHPDPEYWIVNLKGDILFTYIWDPWMLEYQYYVKGLGLCKFSNISQQFTPDKEKLENSNYVKRLLYVAEEVKNGRIEIKNCKEYTLKSSKPNVTTWDMI